MQAAASPARSSTRRSGQQSTAQLTKKHSSSSGHGSSMTTHGCAGGRITTFPAPPVRGDTASAASSPISIFDAVAHPSPRPHHLPATPSQPRSRGAALSHDSGHTARAHIPTTTVATQTPGISYYASYNSLDDCTTGILTTQRSAPSMSNSRSVGNLLKAERREPPPLPVLPPLRTPRARHPLPKALPHGEIGCPVDTFNSYLEVQDCQVVSCAASAATASPDSHGAPTDTPSSPRRTPSRHPQQLPWQDTPPRGAMWQPRTADDTRGAPAVRIPLDCARANRLRAASAATAAPKLVQCMRHGWQPVPAAPRCGEPMPEAAMPGRKSLGALSCCGHSAASSSASPQHSRRVAAGDSKAPRHYGGGLQLQAADLISAHCRADSGSVPMHAQLRSSPFSMSSFCGSDRSGLYTDNVAMRVGPDDPGCSGSETSEVLDSTASGRFADEEDAQATQPGTLASDAGASSCSTVRVLPRVTSQAARVLSYDPGDPQAHVFRTFLHIPEPPARAAAAAMSTAHTQRCFCGGGDTLFGSACMCGGASSFARAHSDSASCSGTGRSETAQASSGAGTCVVRHGASLFDDTSDSDAPFTPTVMDVGAPLLHIPPGKPRPARAARPCPSPRIPSGPPAHPSKHRIRSRSAFTSEPPCACGDVTDSGDLVGTATLPPARGTPGATRLAHRTPACPSLASTRPVAEHAHDICWDTIDRERSMSGTFPLSVSNSTIMLTADVSRLGGRWEDSYDTVSSGCPSTLGLHVEGLVACGRRARGVVPRGPPGAPRVASAERQTPRRSFRRALRDTVVPRLPLHFLHARKAGARSASADPKHGRGFAA